jgi:hypothetical protein
MIISDLFKAEIQAEITRQLTDISVKKTGNTPIERYDLVNKAYVDAKLGTAAHSTGAQTNIASGTSQIALTANSFSNGITWSSSNHNFTIVTAGVYYVTGVIAWSNASGIYFESIIYQNGGATNLVSLNAAPSAGASGVTSMVSGLINCAVGDTIALYGGNNTGGNVASFASNTWLSLFLV